MGCKDNNLFEIDALSEDNVIEAIEVPNKKYIIGVQWHPESMISYDIVSKQLLDSFIESCKGE